MAFMGLARSNFHLSIDLLFNWFKARIGHNPIQIKNPPTTHFLTSLLSVTKAKERHIELSRQFIFSEMLDVELKLKLVNKLINWAKDLKDKSIVIGILPEKNTVLDLDIYVKKLSSKNWSKDSQEVLRYIGDHLIKAQTISDSKRSIKFIESTIEGMIYEYPKQTKIIKKLSDFLKSYKQTLKSLSEL